MEKITFRKKEYDVLDTLSNKCNKIEIKDKFYVLQSFEDYFQLKKFITIYKKLKLTGILMPKIHKIDKKNYLVQMDFINGETILDMLSKDELDVEIYKQIFYCNFYALKERIQLDYRPDKWRFDGKKLYYLGFYYEGDPERIQKFEDDGIKYWVYSREFRDYLKVMNKEVDKNRIKHDYEINKQIVQLVCLYHI